MARPFTVLLKSLYFGLHVCVGNGFQLSFYIDNVHFDIL